MFAIGARVPWPRHARLSSGMRQLDACVCALRMHEVHDALQHRNVFILPDAKILRRNAALRRHRCSFRED